MVYYYTIIIYMELPTVENCIVIENRTITKTSNTGFVWRGFCSAVSNNGAVIEYILSIIPDNVILIIPRSDGNVTRNNEYNQGYHHLYWETDIEPYVHYAKEQNKILIVGVLSMLEYREPDINYLYIPLHDDFFACGLEHFFKQDQLLSWEDRSDELAWRGGCSGIGECNSLRIRFTKEIYKYDPNTNVRIGRWWSENKGIPEELFGEHVDHMYFTRQKIYFIVDGNVIASNHMWGFATGAVPVVISNAYCWFSEFLEPFVNYIPVAHDLSDLIEKIEWVKNNDEAAKQIAQNALYFTRNIFSSEFQKEYLRKNIYKYISDEST
jgi:hypothetical protein